MKKRLVGWLCSALLIWAELLVGCGQGQPAAENLNQTIESIQESKVQEPEASIQESQDTRESTDAATSEETVDSETEEEISYDIIPETYAYSLTVSINPLVELYFDAENTVVGIAYLNQDAVDAYKEEEIVGNKLEEGMKLLMNATAEKGYIKEDATVVIELSKVSEDIQESFDTTILLEVSQTANEILEIVCTEREISLEASVEVAVNEKLEKETGIAAPVVCSDCNGTGNNCKECNGTTIVNCKACDNGIESCGVCKGTAIINCHGCKGAGGADCKHCDGSGRISCDACGGKGTFLCSWCKGELKHICPICWGEGSCPTCGGDGIL